MRGLFALALVAAGCGIGSYNEFRDQLATRWCERQIRCGEVAGTDSQAHCSRPPPLALTERGAVDVPSSIAAHRMIFHPDNAGECLDAVKEAPCDPAAAADDFQRHCHGVVTAGVGAGGVCWGDDECVGSVCVAPDCGGTCTPYAIPGGACVAFGGGPAMTCDPSVHFCGGDDTCQHKVHEGDPCVADENCLFDFVCVAETCAAPPRVEPGLVCGAGLPPCQDGQYCDATGTCQSLKAAADSCDKADACAAGMVCLGGVCSPWLDVGGACNAATAIATGCPASTTCSAGACALAAGLKSGPLAHCSNDSDCDDGLFCSTSGNYCFYVGGVNAVCQSDHECAKDLQCLTGACHTPGYIMCATN